MADYPIIVSVTSLPSRIGSIRPCLESLLSGSVRPDKILIPLPAYSVRQQCSYSLPDFLRNSDFCQQIVEVVPVGEDYGPGTKLLGALSVINDPCCLILADDDVQYKSTFLQGIAGAQRADHSASFSYFTYNAGGITIGQGCDGFSFWSPNIFGIAPFFKKHVYGTNLFFHDDFWISFYLAAKGIPIKSLSGLLNGSGTIYDKKDEDKDSLQFLGGSLSRDLLQSRYIWQLLRDADMPFARRIKMTANAVFDRILAQPSHRVYRKLTSPL